MSSRFIFLALGCLLGATSFVKGEDRVDFNRQIRPLLSNRCFTCHGPDEHERKGDLRLDSREGAIASLGSLAAVVPGDPDVSELLARVSLPDGDEDIMPPKGKGAAFTTDEIALIRRWIEQDAPYATHWSYLAPAAHEVPNVSDPAAAENEIDRFLLARLEKEGVAPAPEADRQTLARRLALDLTGLPPSWAEVEDFVNDSSSDAYEQYVAALLEKPAYGEHWARIWLDLARYADSSGYPSDQPREIWAYRDWVVAAYNSNLPYDQFTVEQIAGDLLPDPIEDQIIATAFHRNTMTQNEGGTDDEEFRNAAVIDRVNTTMAVWMGTTMACAQCHTHKFDPITHHDYFSLYAILNQSADSDKKDESPLHTFFTRVQKDQRATLEKEIGGLEKTFSSPDPTLLTGQSEWERSLPVAGGWSYPTPVRAASAGGASIEIGEDSRLFLAKSPAANDTALVELPIPTGTVEAFRLETLADDRLPGKGPGHGGGNFVITQVKAEFLPDEARAAVACRLRIELVSEKYDFLALAEVQVFNGFENVALKGKATQTSTNPNGPEAKLAIDGNTNGDSAKGKSVSVTGGGTEPQWWELELDTDQPIDRIVVWKRSDKGEGQSIGQLKLTLLDAAGNPVWSHEEKKTFGAREEITVSGRREVRLAKAFADVTQADFAAGDVLSESPAKDKGWAVGGHVGSDHWLTLIPATALKVDRPGRLVVSLAQASQWANHTLGAFRLGLSSDPAITKLAGVPTAVLTALTTDPGRRSPAEIAAIRDHYARDVAPGLRAERIRLAAAKKELQAIKPSTVPIMQELAEAQRRETKIQLRGNWQNLGDVVGPALPAAFPPLPAGAPSNRLGLARWLVSRDNPLTARVTVNRYWEALFGVGIVSTSEEFGSQGELPFHPELLDWLAIDFMDHGWDIKRLLIQLVSTRAYRQDSGVTPELHEKDPENRLLARGPRFRPSGELLRDQALAVGGILSAKMGGPGVRPMAPNLGLKTAFGRDNDWVVSDGEDRHRRSVYTEVRRNGPYASFATFDAPNREVCTIRRGRTNTPLQAFVAMNDPVFIEANQAFARRLAAEVSSGDPAATIRQAYRIALSREADESEVTTLTKLYEEALNAFSNDAAAAQQLATEPVGPAPNGANVAELAAWTTTANVIMNLDEFLMRR